MSGIVIEIKRVSDGAVECYVEKDFEFQEYVWTEGNFSCDCNREIFFNRSQGIDDWEIYECGDQVRFKVCITDAESGAVLLDEIDGKGPV